MPLTIRQSVVAVENADEGTRLVGTLLHKLLTLTHHHPMKVHSESIVHEVHSRTLGCWAAAYEVVHFWLVLPS